MWFSRRQEKSTRPTPKFYYPSQTTSTLTSMKGCTMRGFGRGSRMLNLCVAGAAGKMGNAVIREAATRGHKVVGAVEATGNPSIGKSLRELSIGAFDSKIVGSERI